MRSLKQSLWILYIVISIPALGWDTYNSASLETVSAAGGHENFHVDLNWLSGDPTTEKRVLDYLAALTAPEEEKKFDAMTGLTSEVERIARSQINGVINENEVERRSARAILDLVLKHPSVATIENLTRARLGQLLEDAFALPEEHAIYSADLELHRRKSKAIMPGVAIEPEKAVANFRQKISESFLVPRSQRSNALRFWNVTEETFNQLQRDCGQLARCAVYFENEVAALLSTGRITSTTANRLRGIFELRQASLSTVSELSTRGRNPIQEERISLSANKTTTWRGLGYQAADTIAAGFIPNIDVNHPRNQKGLMLILSLFCVAGLFAWRTAQAR